LDRLVLVRTSKASSGDRRSRWERYMIVPCRQRGGGRTCGECVAKHRILRTWTGELFSIYSTGNTPQGMHVRPLSTNSSGDDKDISHLQKDRNVLKLRRSPKVPKTQYLSPLHNSALVTGLSLSTQCPRPPLGFTFHPRNWSRLRRRGHPPRPTFLRGPAARLPRLKPRVKGCQLQRRRSNE
jgi:hypothetical protein